MKKQLLIAVWCILSGTLGATGQVTLQLQHLLTENLVNPLGINVTTPPRFSWQLSDARRNVQQSAWEIKVTAGKTAVWSSGKINSAQSVQVPYAGNPLQPATKYSWQVRVWDNNGIVTPWSAPATFQTALSTAADWKAQWITPGFTEDAVNRPAILYRKTFSLPKKIRTATAYITAHGLYEARINGQRVGDAYLTPGWTSYNKRLQYQVYDVTPLLVAGSNAIGVSVGNGWYRGYLAWDGIKTPGAAMPPCWYKSPSRIAMVLLRI